MPYSELAEEKAPLPPQRQSSKGEGSRKTHSYSSQS